MKTRLTLFAILFISVFIGIEGKIYAHCDTYDGPVVKDARKALETNNVTTVLKWISPENEQEIIDLFKKTYSLRNGDKEIYEIVQKYFFETLVRLHRESEGEPFTGLKPAGSVSPVITLADNALEKQNIDELLSKLNEHISDIVTEKYEKVIALEKTMDESVDKGRQYVEAYVDYVHTVEALHEIIESGPVHHE